LDKELEKRGHKFVRYADDFRIYVKSLKAAQRVKSRITRFLTVKLRLKVNEEKSEVSRPWLRKFLGFTFFHMYGQSKIKKYWRMSKIKWVAIAMPELYFVRKGLYLPGN
jgi:hypothetical protein